MTVLTAKVASQSQNLQKFAVVYHIHKTANSVKGRDEGKKPAPRIIDVRAWIKGTRTRGRAMATQGYLEREREERERESTPNANSHGAVNSSHITRSK